MAILRKKELRSLNGAELDKKLAELRLELGKSRGSAAVGAAAQNPGRAREVRKTIARILTLKNQTLRKFDQNIENAEEKVKK